MTAVIRAYVPGDAAACTVIFDRAWHAGHPHAPRAVNAAAFANNVRNETILVAEDPDGVVVGFVSVYEPADFIHNLYVDPARHRHGIGKALLDAAVRLAGGRASLKCQQRNTQALRFYRRLGWTDGETGEERGEAWLRLHSPGETSGRTAK